MLHKLYRAIRLQMFKSVWRKKNLHNGTTAETYFPKDNVFVGKKTYGPLKIIWMAPKDTKVIIGNYCSLGPMVTFLVGGEHDYRRISTWPFQSLIYAQKTKGELNRDIVIEDDVWIGYDALIMSGVKIGKGSVVGARAVVARDIPPYSIYVGNKVIKKRFPYEIISKIESLDYTTVEHTFNDEYAKYCQYELSMENVEEVLSAFLSSN